MLLYFTLLLDCKINSFNLKIDNTQKSTFVFKQFEIEQDNHVMKVNTDGILLGAWTETSNKIRALDIGTGTGLVALMLAQKNPEMKIVAVELDKNSALIANQNFLKSKFSNNILLINDSIQNYAIENKVCFDLIVSNPPFFNSGILPLNQNRAGVRHTIHLSHQDLIMAVCKLLSETGQFNIILPQNEGLEFIRMAQEFGMFLTRMLEVRSRTGMPIERMIMTFTKNNELKSFFMESLNIRMDVGNEYSNQFVNLTKDFYLNM